MIDRADTETVLYRTAITALTHPSDPGDEPGYELDEEVIWCLESLPPQAREQLRELVRRVVADPTVHRAEFVARLRDLSEQ